MQIDWSLVVAGLARGDWTLSWWPDSLVVAGLARGDWTRSW